MLFPTALLFYSMKYIYDRDKELNTWGYIRDSYDTDKVKEIEAQLESEVNGSVADSIIDRLQSEWSKVELVFLDNLGKFYNQDLKPEDLEGRLVRLPRSPYDYRGTIKWFAVPLFSPVDEQLRVVMHELCHFYQPVELPRYIKEAVPIILNQMGLCRKEKIGSSEKEKEWRKKFAEYYAEGKTFWDLFVSRKSMDRFMLLPVYNEDERQDEDKNL